MNNNRAVNNGAVNNGAVNNGAVNNGTQTRCQFYITVPILYFILNNPSLG
jgi:hypothetical protein